MLPSLILLENIQQRIDFIPNHRKESKRKEHYGLFLLGYKAGLRVSEAISFDLKAKTEKGLYPIKSKGKKRLVAIPSQVISELKQNNWKPNQTNRFNFYHFLKKVKHELNIPPQIELTPHTLRRAFATYQAEAGLPLPLLQKLLGHSSIRTTALYWLNVYNDGSDDTSDILTSKIWLEKPKKSPIEPEIPVKTNLELLPELFMPSLPVSEPNFAHSAKINQLEAQLKEVQTENNHLKSQLHQTKEQNTLLQQDLAELSEQKAYEATHREQAQQELTIAKKTIAKLEQALNQEKTHRLAVENNLAQEKTLLFTQKQISHNLHQQLKTEQENNQFLKETNTNLKQAIQTNQQTISNLQNTYHQILKEKTQIQNQVNYYQNQLKSIAKTLYQWQKIAYYQQQENQRNAMEAKIIQPQPPPFFKPK